MSENLHASDMLLPTDESAPDALPRGTVWPLEVPVGPSKERGNLAHPWMAVPGSACCNWPVGLMDKASAPGAGNSRFESWADHVPGQCHARFVKYALVS